MVPYRESKLTHFLFPLFSRVGAAGISMVACVSPDPRDYDETLSVLGECLRPPTLHREGCNSCYHVIVFVTENTSLACEIKRIASMRVAPPQRSSTLTDKPRVVSRKRDASVMSRQSSVTTVSDAPAVHSADELVKTLQERLETLEQENEQLQLQQMEREHEIRVEVGNEMAERSASLLAQIKELQDELYEHKHDRTDLTKSVKKMRSMQRIAYQESVAMELRQSEEEMESVKAAYEKEIKCLKSEVRSLRAEAADWKKKAEEAMRIVTSVKEGSGVTTSMAVDVGNIENEVTAAVSFDQRMKRDQRFNKHKKLAELSPKLRNQKNSKENKPREPLSPKSSNMQDEGPDDAEVVLTKSRRSSDALPIAPPMSPGIKGSGPFYPKSRALRSQQLRA